MLVAVYNHYFYILFLFYFYFHFMIFLFLILVLGYSYSFLVLDLVLVLVLVRRVFKLVSIMQMLYQVRIELCSQRLYYVDVEELILIADIMRSHQVKRIGRMILMFLIKSIRHQFTFSHLVQTKRRWSILDVVL